MLGFIFFREGSFVTAMEFETEAQGRAFAAERGYTLSGPYELDVESYTRALGYRDYRDQRGPEYPPIGEQMDRLTKALKYLDERGVDIGPDGRAQVEACAKVKAKFPKNSFVL